MWLQTRLTSTYHPPIPNNACFLTLAKLNSSPPSAAYMSVIQGSIGSDNGLSPIRHQAII